MLRSHAHISEVEREPTFLTAAPQYSNGFTKKVVYEEDVIEGGSHHHHHPHQQHNFLHHNTNPEIRERVEVVEYERVPQYGYGVGEVVYEENVDVRTNPYCPERNRSHWNTYNYRP